MTAEEMLAEARQMALPCVYLTSDSKGGPLAAIWKGPGLVPLKAPKHKHWLTIDCSQLTAQFADLKLTGAISVYSNEEDCKTGRCVVDRNLTSLVGAKGKPLYAQPSTSVPPFTQLLRHATPRIREWMEKVGCDVTKPFFTSKKGVKEVCKAYYKLTTVGDPLTDGESPVFAVLGGWPVDIYEDGWAGDTKGDSKARQFVFTYRESEPWIRVWVDGAGEFHVQQIIT